MRRVATRRRALTAAVAAAALGAAGLAAAAAAQAAPSRAPVPGTWPAWATTAHRVSAPSVTRGNVSARVYLAGQDPAGLAAYASAVSDPKSPEYGRYLTPVQAQQRFGTTQAQITAVRDWLISAGLRVTSANEHYIAVAGSAVSVQRAFSVRFGSFRAPDGAVARAPEQNASVPDSLAGSVLTITGLDTAKASVRPLDTLPPPGPNFYVAGPCSQYWAQQIATDEPAAYGTHQPYALCGYTPRQYRGAYGVARSGLTGKGKTIAIVDAYASPTMLADANQYAQDVGDAPFRSGQYREVLPPSYDLTTECDAPGWYGEESLDVEVAHGMAPDANLTYVGAADCTDPSLLDALTKIVDSHLADVVSNSWGETEDQTTGAAMAAYNLVFEMGTIEGIGFNFSSGDCGYEDPANSCGSGRDGSDKIQVDWPTSSPWVTSVGGTSLAVNSGNSYQFETGWGVYRVGASDDNTSWTPTPPGTYPANYTSGAGGGTSTIFRQPFYQRNVVPASLSRRLPDGTISATPMREVPDIAADADPQTGFLFGETVQLSDASYGFALSRIGGTSLASPLTAGILADVMQGLRHPLGLANPLLYALYRTPAFHDVTGTPLGPNVPVAVARNDYTDPSTATGPIIHSLRTTGMDGGGAALLSATKGYDDVTGLGSPSLGFLRIFRNP
jgi:subtilase family serine protease